MNGIQVLFLVLIVAVLVFGFGVVFLNRAKGSGAPRAPRTNRAPVPRPAPPRPPEATLDPIVESAVEAAVDDAILDEETAEEAIAAEEIESAEPPRFRDRIGKARAALTGVFIGVRARGGITPDTWDDLEEALLKADVGVRVADELLDGLRARVKAKEIVDADQLLDALQAEMTGRLHGADRELHFEPGEVGSPNVWLFVGVNGVGKTTTIGKVGAQQIGEGRTVLMAAGDTFRAAAAEQLGTWAERSGAELVRGAEGGDPSSVIFDGVQRAAAKGIDLVLADTAGRLQNKTNLMEELRKVRRVAGKEPGRVTEVLLVIDATTGQNGLSQAREFGDATEVTGVVLTKLDGSARGGIVFAIETELGIPVKLVGLGETIGDLVPFDPDEFVSALFE
jgi:fused signal recognition particle receptor